MVNFRHFNSMKICFAVISFVSFYNFAKSEVSMCSSDIFLNSVEDPAVKFHTNSLEELESSARTFCSQHQINEENCEVLKTHHTNHCFSDRTVKATDDSIIIEEELINKSSNDYEDSPSKTVRVEDSRIISVDHSVRVGPILAVSHQSEIRNMQAYQGETKVQTVKRFCGMLKLDIEQCNQVEKSYFSLFDSIDSDSNSKKESENVNSGDYWSKFSFQECKNLIFELEIVKNIHEKIAEYWKWFTLLVAGFYVYLTEQH